jgi:hypothetical protein
MNFGNIAIPAITLLAPLAASLYFLLPGRSHPEVAAKWGSALFGLLMLVSLIAVARLDKPVLLEFLWPFAAEPSGYFEFTLQLHWIRYVWIFFSSFVLLIFTAFDGLSSFQGDTRGGKFAFVAGASLFTSLAYLSENVFLSVIFIEFATFLLYALSVSSGEEERDQERISYFKRSWFVFLALLAVLGLSFTRELDLSSIVLLGVVLYIISFIFSRHSFSGWRYLCIALLQAGAAFFLLGRVVGEDMSQELLLPLATLFGVTVAIFSWPAIIAVSSLGSAFWTLFSFLGYLLFLRFSSGRHGEVFWGSYEAIGLLSVLAIGTILRFGPLAAKGWEKAFSFLCAGVLLAILSGALPGVDIAGARVSMESPIKLAGLGALTFLLSMVVGKSLAVSFAGDKSKSASQSFFPGLIPALAVLVIEAAGVVKMTDLYGESPFRMGPLYLLTNPHIIVAAAAIAAGLLAGALLGFNSRFRSWARAKELRMESIFPGIDPAILGWNRKIVSLPELAIDRANIGSHRLLSRGASLVQAGDRLFFGEKLYRGVREYSHTLSRATRFFHTGGVRAYVFMGVLITLAASAIFLLEGR